MGICSRRRQSCGGLVYSKIFMQKVVMMTQEEKRKVGMFFPTRKMNRDRLRKLTKVAFQKKFEPTMTPGERTHDLKASMYKIRDKRKPNPGEPALVDNVDVIYNRATRRRLARQLARRAL